jgi:predicted amidohydrolase YtcJ
MTRNEQLYLGGEIYTVDDACPTAEAVAVRDGMIVAVGDRSYCRSALGRRHDAIDLNGCAMLPGFIDTHLHPLLMIYFDMNTNLHGTSSLEELQERLREAEREKAPELWVVGLNFDEQFFAIPSVPSRHDLDVACPDQPAIVVRHDGHMIIANTRALEVSGITGDTPDPGGGTIDREPDGFPAGPFRENAVPLILGAMPLPDQQTIIDTAISSFHRLTQLGITSAGIVLQTSDEGPAGAVGSYDIPIMQMLVDYLKIHLYAIVTTSDMAKVQELMHSPLNNPAGRFSRRVGAVKLHSDGTFGSCTAFMREPFSDYPDKSGFLKMSGEKLYRRMVDAHRANFQIAVHAIGDAANRTCVDLYERLLTEYPRTDHRHRVEHASVLDPSIISDMARLGIVVSTQPMFIHSEKNWLHRRLGSERLRWTYPFRSLIDGGVRVAGASDAPVESIDVLHAIQCCVTREGFEVQECIAPDQAIRMFTLDAAYAQFEEDVSGSISPGKRADFVVLSDNPVRIAPDRIINITVEKTVIGGEVVYSR